ncbi:MAG: mannose-6-phosphate isomerase, class I [Desulfobacterales bacterium]|jgi:mannose-6-phosphate isomerase
MWTIKYLKNTIQNYDWGSLTAIPDLLGKQNSSRTPMAELWMGAHPKAPSLVNCQGQWQPLTKLIAEYPQDILGNTVASSFDNQLPYLFKVLAAAKPLSIQAHPSLDQAREGFAKEIAMGIAMDAPDRNYKDANHKPECICALSQFWALSGFRDIPDIIDLVGKSCPVGLAPELAALNNQPDAVGLKRFFTDLMTMNFDRKRQVVAEAIRTADLLADQELAFSWVKRLSVVYSDDIGIFSPLLLNLVELNPGEALFLPAGELHAYLKGVGLELMANSDNVLRGGLTPKHVDVPELLNVLNFKPRTIQILEAIKKTQNESVYASKADEFVLSMITIANGIPYQSSESRGVEIMLCTQGSASLMDIGSGEMISIKRGDSVIVPAAVTGYTATGEARIYKASVP